MAQLLRDHISVVEDPSLVATLGDQHLLLDSVGIFTHVYIPPHTHTQVRELLKKLPG